MEKSKESAAVIKTADPDGRPKLRAELILEAFSSEFLDRSYCSTWLANFLHPDGPRCPDCGQLVTEGRAAQAFYELRRLQCRGCERWFTALTGTTLQGSKLNFRQIILLAVFLALNIEPSLIAATLGISTETVRTWRLRLA